MDADELRFAFCSATAKAEAWLSQGGATTTALSRFKQAAVHDERMMSAQANALQPLAALLDGLEAYAGSRDWWLLRNTIKFSKRLHAMLFYQRLEELWRVMEAFKGGPCWKLLTTLRSALARDELAEKRVVTPEFLRRVSELGAELDMVFEHVKVLARRAAEALFMVFAKGSAPVLRASHI